MSVVEWRNVVVVAVVHRPALVECQMKILQRIPPSTQLLFFPPNQNNLLISKIKIHLNDVEKIVAASWCKQVNESFSVI